MTMNNDSLDDIIRRAQESRTFRKALVTKNLYLFARTYFPEAMFAPTANFHREMFKLAAGDAPLLVVSGFRGCGKSFVFTQCYPLYAAMAQGIHFIVIFSDTQQQAEQHLANIRDVLERDGLLRKDFGLSREEFKKWAQNEIIIPRYDTKILAVSAGQSVRGLKYKHYRPQLIIADDIQDMKSVRSDDGREKDFHYFQSEILFLGGVGKETRIVVVGNLLHPLSTLMRLGGAIESGQMSGVFRAYPLEREDGSIAWPERYTPEVLAAERKKFLDEADYQREMNLKFISTQESVVEREWIQYYDRLPDAGYVRGFVMGCDPAISKKQTSDCTAIVSGIVCNSGEETKLFLYPDPFNDHVNFPETVDELERRYNHLMTGYRPVDVRIEAIGYQKSLPEQVNSLGRMKATADKLPYDKRTRFAILGYLIREGKILFPRKGCETVIEQLVGFGKESRDDLCDALCLAAFAVLRNTVPGFIFPKGPYRGPESGLSNEETLAMLKDPVLRKPYEDEADRDVSQESEGQRMSGRSGPWPRRNGPRKGGFIC